MAASYIFLIGQGVTSSCGNVTIWSLLEITHSPASNCDEKSSCPLLSWPGGMYSNATQSPPVRTPYLFRPPKSLVVFCMSGLYLPGVVVGWSCLGFAGKLVILQKVMVCLTWQRVRYQMVQHCSELYHPLTRQTSRWCLGIEWRTRYSSAWQTLTPPSGARAHYTDMSSLRFYQSYPSSTRNHVCAVCYLIALSMNVWIWYWILSRLPLQLELWWVILSVICATVSPSWLHIQSTPL